MPDEEVGLALALKNRRQVAAGIDDVGDRLGRTSRAADTLSRKSRIASAGMLSIGKSGRIAGRAAVYGLGAATTAVVGTGIILTKLSKDSIGEAREAQKVGGVTRQEIKATGGAANVSRKSIERLSGAISEKVGIDDEEIQSGANLVLMYKNVQNQQGKGNKIFNRSIRDATDMAAVTGTLTTSSKVLGKVLNDPLKALTGLSKYGVKWTDEQEKQIKYDVEHNKVLDAQKLILDQVEDRVGGVAAAQATWGEKASVTMGNLKEDFGTILLPYLDQTEKWFVQKGGPVVDDYIGKFESKGIPAIKDFAGTIQDRGIPALHDFYDEAKPIAKSILPAIGTGFDAVKDAVVVIAPKMKSIFDGFNSLPDWAKESIAIGAGGAYVANKLGAGKLLFGKGGAGGSGGLLGGGSTPANPVWVRVVGRGGATSTTSTNNVGGLPSADERRQPSTRKPSRSALDFAAGPGPFLLYPFLTGSQAPGQNGPPKYTSAGQYYDTKVPALPSSTTLGASSVAGFDRQVSHLGNIKQQAAAISAFAQALVPSPANGVTIDKVLSELDTLMPKTRRAVGESTSDLVRNQQALSDIDRIFKGVTVTGANYGVTMAGVGSTIATKLTPRMADAQDHAATLERTLGGVSKDWHASLTVDGINDAESRISSIQTKLNELSYMGIGGDAPSSGGGGGGKHKGGGGHDASGRSAASLPPIDVHTHLHLDGREIAQSTVRHLQDQAAQG